MLPTRMGRVRLAALGCHFEAIPLSSWVLQAVENLKMIDVQTSMSPDDRNAKIVLTGSSTVIT